MKYHNIHKRPPLGAVPPAFGASFWPKGGTSMKIMVFLRYFIIF